MDEHALEMVAERFRVLSEPARLRILAYLKEHGETHVTELMEGTGLGQANLSKHLGVLLTGGMVSRRKLGLKVFYKISDPVVFTLCDMMCRSIEKSLTTKIAKIKGIKAKNRAA